MVIKKIYDEKTKTQKVWFDSTMILYCEMVEYETENKGDLYITFKNGITYKYIGVKFEDYVLFISGGTDASHGKTLNKVIKPAYEFEKIGNADVKAIMDELNKVEEDDSEKEITYFISGHRDINDIEFEANYIPLIGLALYNTPNAKFVVGDCDGVDIKAQNYLMDNLGLDPERVTVYHMFEEPKNKNEKITKTKGGFTTDDERDEAMTNASFEDIALVRDVKKLSGTAQNILRRYILKQISR